MIIIPAIDLKNGQCVRLRQGRMEDDTVFSDDPVAVATQWVEQGARRLHLVDLDGAFAGEPRNASASSDNRDTMYDMVEQVASEVFIPLTVGGGIRAVSDVRRLLNAGADKVGINTAAVHNPELVREATDKVGSQCIVVGEEPRWEIFTHGGRTPTGIDTVAWARKMAAYGAGELLLTSMDRDGTKIGFDLGVTKAVSDAVEIPVIASGGVGDLQHLCDGVNLGGADAVLAASIFHFGEYSIGEAKAFMQQQGIEVRL
ncbi:UNVERIFIED_CONTAM: hypothetical protein GTU68_035814 [Idotea baltica]|nr:hypothetical protein [Idotea baltica]